LKLVLLPGMDGTGKLFSPLLNALSGYDCEIIALPKTGSQDYPSITSFVRARLPKDQFVLVAESFSGPIGAALAAEGIENMKGIIFVATFLSTPKHLLLYVSRCLPLKILSEFPFVKIFYKAVFFGVDASNEIIQVFKCSLNSLPRKTITRRLSTMLSLKPNWEAINLPVGYIQAASDRLVPPNKSTEFTRIFKNMTIKIINGPHFILQAKPAECAAAISELLPIFLNHEYSGVIAQ